MAEFVNSSKEPRPDAVSRDFLTAFCMGPIGISDTSQGAMVRAWRARLVGNEVLIAAAGETEWVDEFVQLTLTDGIGVREVDIAFTQSADAVIVLERADGNIWIYWFDPTIPGLDLVNLGPGRNPKVVLDDPFDVTNSDVQLFYMSDTADALVYRTQRERYDTEHLTPITDVANLYLEDAIRDSRLRLHLIASERDSVSGRYPKGFFSLLSTILFPYLADPEQLDEPVLSVLISEVIKEFDVADSPVEQLDETTLVVVAAIVVSSIIEAELVEQLDEAELTVVTAIVVEAVITEVLDAEQLDEATISVLDAAVTEEITILHDFAEALDEPELSVLTAIVEVA